MIASKTVESGTLADVKEEFKTFNAKLRRVLKGKPRKELAEELGISTGTIGSWLSRGSQPPYHQLAPLCKSVGCSPEYLIDDSIPIDADPKQGAADTPLTDGELVARLRSRYIEEARRAHDYLNEYQGIPWFDVARRLIALDTPDPEAHELMRATQLVDFLPSLLSHTIGPFLPAFSGEGVPDRLKPESIKKRIDAIAFSRSFGLVVDLLPVLRGVAVAKRYPERDLDLTGSKRLIEDLGLELVELEQTGFHLIDTFYGVSESGGLEAYFDSVISRARKEITAGAKQASAKERVKKIIETGCKLIIKDAARQSAYEAEADEAWRAVASVKIGRKIEPDEQAKQDRLDRMETRYNLLIQAFTEYATKAKPK